MNSNFLSYVQNFYLLFILSKNTLSPGALGILFMYEFIANIDTSVISLQNKMM